MKKELLIIGLIGALIGGVIVWFLAVKPVNNNYIGMMGLRQMMNQNSGQSTTSNMMGNIDAHFIEQMIPHHEDAITMAKVAQQKAQHAEIKVLANNIVTSQSAENNQMKNFYKDWFGTEVPAGDLVMKNHGMMGGSNMHMGMMGGDMDLEKLQSTPTFDKVFIEQMIPHHQMAVMMAGMLKGGTQRPEMKKLAEDIITAQTKEIEQMRQWYSDWGY